MGKVVKVILIVLALLLGLLLLAALLVPESQWARNWLEDQASQRLEGREVEIADIDIDWAWPPTVRVTDVRIANPDWAEHEYLLELDALEFVPDMDALLSGKAGLQRLDIEQPRLHLARRADGSTSWGELIAEDSNEPPVMPDILTINGGHLTYQDALLNTSVEARMHTTDKEDSDRRLVVTGEGELKNTPLTFDAWGATPLQALDGDATYPLAFEGKLGELQFSFDGQTRDPLQPDEIQGQLAVTAPREAEPANLVDLPQLSVPAFELEARLERDGPRWILEDIALQSKESRLTGSATMLRGKPLQFDIELHADRLNLNRWNVLDQFSANQQEKTSGEDGVPFAERLAQQFAILRGRQIQLEVTVDELLYGDQSMQDLALEASLAEDRLEVVRLQAQQGESQLQASGSLTIAENEVEGEMKAHLDQFDLRQALKPIRQSDLGVLDGDLNLRFRGGAMTLHDTQLNYDAPAQELNVQFNADSRQLPNEPVPGLHVEGTGLRHGEPFRFDLDLGPLLDLTAIQKPYRIKGMLASRDSILYVDGTIVRPLGLKSADTKFRLEGPNPARINKITGLSLPPLPPYQIEGRMRWEDNILRMTGFTGTFGESDLGGDVRLRTGGNPKVWATLHSASMDFDDIRPLWGSAPGTGEGEIASERQKRIAREQEQTGLLFSDKPWNPDAFRRMDAKVNFTADSINAQGVPLGGLSAKLKLQNGRLTLRPLSFGIGGGKVESYIRIDAGQTRVTGQLETSLTGVSLKPLLRDDFPQIAGDSAGIIGGEIDVSFAGISMSDFMASADGQMEFAISGGHFDMLALELLGLDAGEALVASLAEADQVPLRCAYLRFQAENGQANLDQLFVDTDDTNFTGSGSIDLQTERIDLELESHPKDASIFTANSPVHLRGTLKEPSVEVTSTELFVRGIASAIGLAVAPPLAILPWIDPGMGEGVGPGCRQVLSKFRSGQ